MKSVAGPDAGRPEEQAHLSLARKGSRPCAAHDQRTQSTYLFGAVCPERKGGAALVLPACNAEAMQLHLNEIATKVALGAHAILILDQAGWASVSLVLGGWVTICRCGPLTLTCRQRLYQAAVCTRNLVHKDPH